MFKKNLLVIVILILSQNLLYAETIKVFNFTKDELNSLKVKKTPMSPMVLNSSIKKVNEDLNQKKIMKFKNKIREYQKFIKKNFDYVGENFAYEARSIHYNAKKKSKGIYGKATNDEVKSLNEEGIETQIITWIKDKDN